MSELKEINMMLQRYAITAMHCVEGATNLVVSLGEHKLGGNVESLAPQTIRVESVIRRPDYTESNVNNDIAILKLSSVLYLEVSLFVNSIAEF